MADSDRRRRVGRALITLTVTAACLASLVGADMGPAAATVPPSTITTVLGGTGKGPSATRIATAPDGTMAFLGTDNRTAAYTGLMVRTPDGVVTQEPPQSDCLSDTLGQPYQCMMVDVAIGPDGASYVLTAAGRIVRKVTGGASSTLATQASWNVPFWGPCVYFTSLAFGPSGTMYVAGPGGIYTYDPGTGVSTRVAGNGAAPTSPTEGDGLLATEAPVCSSDLAVDSSGNLLLSSGTVVRRVDHATQRISTIAGSGTRGSSGDGGPAVEAQLTLVRSIALDRAGNLFIGDESAYRVRMVNPAGMISTVAGNGVRNYDGDGGPALDASLTDNLTVGVDLPTGDVWIGETCGCTTTAPKRGVRRVSRRGAIAGTATVDGSPAAGVLVSAVSDTSLTPLASAYTQADGSYQVVGLPAGRYRIRFWDPQGRYGRVWYADTPAISQASVLTVTADTETRADQVLTDTVASMTGFVGDGTGTVAGVQVQVFGPTGWIASTTTGAQGGYTIAGLAPGTYWVRFVGPPGGTHLSTWYRHAVLFPNAQPVTLTTGPNTINGAVIPRP